MPEPCVSVTFDDMSENPEHLQRKRHAEPQLTLVSRERSEEHRDARALCSDAYAAR